MNITTEIRTMKQTLLFISSFVIATTSFAQVGAVAPNLIQTDINGVTHNLYDYLNEGKVVIVDMSATWCGPCWSFHNGDFLNDLNSEFGPTGTDEAVVLFFEDDVQGTTLADLYGTGNNTQGDWVTGANFPIINSTVVLPLEYGTGYPSVSVICPMDKKIKADLTNYSTLAQMTNSVQTVINDCAFTGVDDVSADNDFVLFPNPASVSLTIKHSLVSNSFYKIFSITGQEIQSGTVTMSENQIGVSKLADGIYFLQLFEGSKALGRQKFIKSAQ